MSCSREWKPNLEKVVAEVKFLLDRLDDYNPDDDGLREFCRHIIPSMERLRTLIGSDKWTS
jgi:hypothetical protein